MHSMNKRMKNDFYHNQNIFLNLNVISNVQNCIIHASLHCLCLSKVCQLQYMLNIMDKSGHYIVKSDFNDL